MNSQFESLMQLGRAEKIQLVEDLWDSIAKDETPLPVPDWKRDELRRRKQRFQEDPSSALSWDEVKALARSRND